MARTILIVDDSPDMHALLEARLRAEGVQFHKTMDASAAVDLALVHAPDVILLDVNMPGLSGFDVCRQLKADARTAHIPVIFLSGVLDQETKVRGLDLGAVDYVTKPFEVAELRARVRSALRIKQLQDQLMALARIDELTGLWNRAYLDSRLAQELAATRRDGRALALIMLDIDHFKRVNDEHGHATGDDVLRQVAAELRSKLRSSDIACRYGGEEFAVILPGTDVTGAAVVAERVCRAIRAKSIATALGTISVTASLGLVALSDLAVPPEITVRRLFTSGDEALYHAKRSGRDQVCLYNTLVVKSL